MEKQTPTFFNVETQIDTSGPKKRKHKSSSNSATNNKKLSNYQELKQNEAKEETESFERNLLTFDFDDDEIEINLDFRKDSSLIQPLIQPCFFPNFIPNPASPLETLLNNLRSKNVPILMKEPLEPLINSSPPPKINKPIKKNEDYFEKEKKLLYQNLNSLQFRIMKTPNNILILDNFLKLKRTVTKFYRKMEQQYEKISPREILYSTQKYKISINRLYNLFRSWGIVNLLSNIKEVTEYRHFLMEDSIHQLKYEESENGAKISIESILKLLIEENCNNNMMSSNILMVKINEDARYIEGNDVLKSVISISIFNEMYQHLSLENVFPIVIGNNLTPFLKEINVEIKQLQSKGFEIFGKIFKVIFTMTSDWASLKDYCLDGKINKNTFCPYCDHHHNNRKSETPSTLRETMSQLGIGSKYTNPCILHGETRQTGCLIRNMMRDNDFNQTDFTDFLDGCGAKGFSISETDVSNSDYERVSLKGNVCETIIAKIPAFIIQTFDNIRKKYIIGVEGYSQLLKKATLKENRWLELWDSFSDWIHFFQLSTFTLNSLVPGLKKEDLHQVISKLYKRFLKSYNKLFDTIPLSSFSWYFHILSHHGASLISRFGSLHPFSTQTNELNHVRDRFYLSHMTLKNIKASHSVLTQVFFGSLITLLIRSIRSLELCARTKKYEFPPPVELDIQNTAAVDQFLKKNTFFQNDFLKKQYKSALSQTMYRKVVNNEQKEFQSIIDCFKNLPQLSDDIKTYPKFKKLLELQKILGSESDYQFLLEKESKDRNRNEFRRGSNIDLFKKKENLISENFSSQQVKVQQEVVNERLENPPEVVSIKSNSNLPKKQTKREIKIQSLIKEVYSENQVFVNPLISEKEIPKTFGLSSAQDELQKMNEADLIKLNFCDRLEKTSQQEPILIDSKENEILVDKDEDKYKVGEKEITIHKKHFECLNENITNPKLNDEVMNLLISIYQKETENPSTSKTYVFNTFFITQLQKNFKNPQSKSRLYSKDFHIQKYDLILIPCHIVDHWTLVMISILEKNSTIISYIDSLKGSFLKQKKRIIKVSFNF